jgi:hypothetical protein
MLFTLCAWVVVLRLACVVVSASCAAAGASYEVTDPDKGNPAQIAAYWGHLEAVVKLVEAGCSWPHGKTARGVAGGDVVKWICNITTNKVCSCPAPDVLLRSASDVLLML